MEFNTQHYILVGTIDELKLKLAEAESEIARLKAILHEHDPDIFEMKRDLINDLVHQTVVKMIKDGDIGPVNLPPFDSAEWLPEDEMDDEREE